LRVSIRQLREVSGVLLDHLERLGISDVEVDADYYWHIPREQVYDATLERLEPDLGQLSEDWEKLEAIRRGELPAVAPALEWLGAVYRAVGERVDG
jgi:hypothetical protein